MLIRPNRPYLEIFQPDFNGYEIDLWGGRGRGGSYHLTLKAIQLSYTQKYFRGYFVRAIQNSIRLSLWKDFLDRLEELSELNGRDISKDFKINNQEMSAVNLTTGNEIYSKGFRSSMKSNTANMKSLAGATDVFIEELEEVGENEYNVLADSIRTKKSDGVKIWRAWNAPPKDKWFIRDYYMLEDSGVPNFYKAVPKGIPGHVSIFSNYRENIENIDRNTIGKYERYQQNNPKYYYNQIMGFISDGGDARVYYGWKRISYLDYLKIDGYEVYGVDFGDTAPTSLVSVKYKDGIFYRHELLYRPLREMNLAYRDEVMESDSDGMWEKHAGVLTHVFNMLGVDKDIPMFCDPAQNGLIIELRRAGYMAVGAKKDKASNINIINRAANYYTDISENLEREYEDYYLEVDINKNPIDGKPIKSNDHLMDAQEYACRGIFDELGLSL